MKLFRIIRWILFVAVAAGMIAMAVSPHLGRTRHLWDVLSNFRVQAVGAAVLGALAVIFLDGKKSGVLLLAGALGLSAPLWPYLPRPWERLGASARDASFEVMILNLDMYAFEHDGVLPVVTEDPPDVLVLMEFDQRWSRDLRALEEKYTFRYLLPRPDFFGLAVYSNLPVNSIEIVGAGPLNIPIVKAVCEAGGKPFVLLGTHAGNPQTYLGWKMRGDSLDKMEALVIDSDLPVILVGDYNCTPWSEHFKKLLAGKLRDTARGFGFMGTYPSWGLPAVRLLIDHILVSDAFRVLDRRLQWPTGSDHVAVRARLELL
ncbi:MAG: endonuclease/exonuclease/phosphatase family protein [Candidatus Omnitrophica bacterium]|nr:endonuclease/exonuclease/phosphatase family protein [Candidatus Omnitrophota bacterium]